MSSSPSEAPNPPESWKPRLFVLYLAAIAFAVFFISNVWIVLGLALGQFVLARFLSVDLGKLRKKTAKLWSFAAFILLTYLFAGTGESKRGLELCISTLCCSRSFRCSSSLQHEWCFSRDPHDSTNLDHCAGLAARCFPRQRCFCAWSSGAWGSSPRCGRIFRCACPSRGVFPWRRRWSR